MSAVKQTKEEEMGLKYAARVRDRERRLKEGIRRIRESARKRTEEDMASAATPVEDYYHRETEIIEPGTYVLELHAKSRLSGGEGIIFVEGTVLEGPMTGRNSP